ncbi:hypothetical protein [Lactiplantibacillus mudanjiangensis]|uniref:Membrane protein [Lactobacillus koreensis] n=1 Tax=Lactiplantibacillus mudanjiangensis TaxID=1296538 RepID=A0A660E0W4_9LACO|nr:hypothetical protein [Lactiplantibacillus mudanjiangensis]VDG25517.1 membrane protein [Lactobacillus koreensis] [Lactiplantibacillus mudanjiangensis]VDG29131.1 membrane protein [Lactobacillus koreensis] [Lactiplantibacillus mudanjiangensis]
MRHLFTTRPGRDYLIGFAFILIMVGLATYQQDYEIILPEIGALTTGTWIYRKATWINQPVKIFLAPAGTAIIGFLVNQLALGYAVKVYLTLLLILVLLSILRSTLAPSFATGLLPIIVNATHWVFIVAIVVFTASLMIGVFLQGTYRQTAPAPKLQWPTMLGFMLAATLWIGVVWRIDQPQMAGIPPVLVVFFEVAQLPTYSGKLAIKHIIALSGAATLGVVSYYLLGTWLLATLISLPLVFIMLSLLNLKLPAAYAFPLLALVLPTNMFHGLPLTASLAAIFFLGTVYLYKQVMNRLSWTSENES